MPKNKLTKNKLIFFILYISIVICILSFTLNLEILIIPYIIFLSILFVNINLGKKNNNEINNIKIETKIYNNETSNDEIKTEIKNKKFIILDIILNIILIIPILPILYILFLRLSCPTCFWMFILPIFLNPISILMIIIYLFVLYTNLSRLLNKIK